MNHAIFLTTAANPAGQLTFTVGWVVIMAVALYFIAIRPQKKQQKALEALIATIETGDSILTTSGFYGVVIDVMDEVIIVEFGNNKNCRIPMKKTAVVEVEKAKSAE